MKKRINLLSKQKKYLNFENLLQRLRLAILVIGIVVLFLDIGFFAVLIKQKTELDLVNEQKKGLLTFLVANKEAETKFIYLRTKENQVANFLKNDVNFFPYYNLLNESLQSASPQARLDSVLIDKDRATEFAVGFDDFVALLSFFKFTETPVFLNNFSELTLGGFNIIQQEKKSYQLSFKGKFTQVK